MAHRIVFSVNDERCPPPPLPPLAELLSFNLCAVISLHRQWNWCALFPLIKSKSRQGAWLHGGRRGGRGPGPVRRPTEPVPSVTPSGRAALDQSLSSRFLGFEVCLSGDFPVCGVKHHISLSFSTKHLKNKNMGSKAVCERDQLI